MYIQFSDAAKFADIARNIVNGNGFVSNFSFFNPNLLGNSGLFSTIFTPPAMPYAIAVFFKLFGVSDETIIATSLFFFFLTAIFTFLLGRKLFGKTVGILASLVIIINQNFWEYAKTGASETLFMLEIIIIPYLILLKKKWATAISVLLLFIMYFTRPQAFIFIAGYILFYLLFKFKIKKAIIIFIKIFIFGLVFDKLILIPLNGKHFLYSLIGRGTHAITQHSQYIAVSDVIRGVERQTPSLILTIKKTGTNIFNFYRSLPQILNPYLFTFFVLSPLVLFKKKEERVFVGITFFTTFLSFLLPALTIPFYRYIHPVLPLVYITGIASLVSIIRRIIPKELNKKFTLAFISAVLVSVFVLIMQVGIYIHDYKYYEVRRNYGEPPLYAILSWKMKEVTDPDDVIITNLDTWGSWYGERKTIWFPLKPDQLMPPEGKRIPFDAIYLTSYLMDDENYYMGEEWRQIFYNPENPEDIFIAENYELKEIIEIDGKDVYEKQDARAVLLVKKSN
jgi:4-amino-4-deoxy-L-arabinose transferase-like glycosyltransferase